MDAKFVLVTRDTRLRNSSPASTRVEQARFYVEHLGADFSDYRAEHDRYRAATAEAEAVLRLHGRVQRLSGATSPTSSSAPPTWWWCWGRTGSSPTR